MATSLTVDKWDNDSDGLLRLLLHYPMSEIGYDSTFDVARDIGQLGAHRSAEGVIATNSQDRHRQFSSS
jgi:hypothetical protein